MSDSPTANVPVDVPIAKAQVAPKPAMTTLKEFVMGISTTDRRIELIGAFVANETSAKRTVATQKDFSDRLAAFAKQPELRVSKRTAKI